MRTHNSFSLRSRAFQRISESVCKTAKVLRRVSGGCCPVLLLTACCSSSFCGHAVTSPGRFSAFKRVFSKRAPRAMGVSSRSCVSGCGRFLASSDGHDRCPSCLGYQHAEAALHGPPASPGQGVEAVAPGWCCAGTAHSDGLHPKGDKSHSAGPGSDDVHISGPGAPPVADLGGYEGVRQASLTGLQAGLFGEAVEDFAHQFSAAQKQMEAFRHILPWRSAAVSTPPPAAAPQSARRRGRPPAASTSAPTRPQLQPSQRPQRGAGRRKVAQPASARLRPPPPLPSL